MINYRISFSNIELPFTPWISSFWIHCIFKIYSWIWFVSICDLGCFHLHSWVTTGHPFLWFFLCVPVFILSLFLTLWPLQLPYSPPNPSKTTHSCLLALGSLPQGVCMAGCGVCCCCSVTKSCLTLCDPIDYSPPGSFSPPLSPGVCSKSSPLSRWHHPIISSSASPFSFCPQSFPASGSFPVSWLFPSGGQSIGASASAAVLPIFRVDFLWDWPVWSCSPGDSQESSPAQFKSISSLVLSLLDGPTLTSVHDYWKNHSFDYMDLCRQSGISAL